MKYALKRLITGLGVGREAARPCYSLALAQVRRCVWQEHSLAGQRVEFKGKGGPQLLGKEISERLLRGCKHPYMGGRKRPNTAYLQQSPDRWES